MDMLYQGQEQEETDIQEIAGVLLRRQTEWRIQANQVYRRTHLANFEVLVSELETAQGTQHHYLPIRFYSADYALSATTLRIERAFSLDKLALVFRMRMFLQDVYMLHEHVKLSVVKPIPTPYHQSGLDAIYVS